MRLRMMWGAAGAVLLALSGCASTDVATEPHDPYESFNRNMFAFNKALDENLFSPIADGYVAITPEPAREAVFNFFDNLGYLTTVVNQLLQGKTSRPASRCRAIRRISIRHWRCGGWTRVRTWNCRCSARIPSARCRGFRPMRRPIC
jgi:ABC-type transporter lipoprotein component MlaA